MKALAVVVSAAALAGCAGMLDPGNTPKAVIDAQANSWEGWVRFSGEEFQYFANENISRLAVPRPCVSGTLPRDLRRQAFQGVGPQKVRITGRTVAWTGREPGDRIDHGGSNITNTCGGAVVILADSLVPIA